MKKAVKKDISKKIRLRFPPSPTGNLHIGNARTILFNYLFAKKNGGKTILRIEDTDKERSKLEYVQNIIDELKWLGIEWDEGPDIDGKFGPYKQSQRIDIYKKYLEILLNDNKAYYCFCTADELAAKRQNQIEQGIAPKYDGKCRNLSKEEIDKNISESKKSVIRFKVESKKVKFTDLIRGEVEFDMGLIGDMVIAKDLETPLYHFAVVIDDYEMEISHIIRGEDHISNTPKQIILQEALDFYHPIYAHLPLMLNQDRSKMSKRAGDVAVIDYHQAGYLPEAMVNFIALIGWNPGIHSDYISGQTEQEIFSMKDLIESFSIEKVQKGGASFNTQKLDSINSFYIKEKPIKKLVELCKPYFKEGYENFSEKTLEKIVELHRTRMKKLSDITDMTDFFFNEKLNYNKGILSWKKAGESETKDALMYSEKIISSINKFTKENLEKVLLESATEFNKEKNYPEKDRGYLLWPLRVALSGKEASAGPFEIADILGKEKTLQRINNAIESL
ncbi:MAG: glutamate--tRNA ligase [Candidatus Staskawiczbacteria bacterium RIFCSPHIGHO2_02_FULL_34_9]|uniref:Glutamate--tRNA ligase n=1 Tax=Candidatus Staskawiczbacteria bacterium RIFCSPHIGHO2_02_FULL_34_9 TaxID=1802206 RepID=A0A1G2I365_9BACT|nr:MAG: glutamate--tRNA ligase [Candidatus Staskawiczbacteria bacterium RIFCSPHIGHO2_02_FULL_34_9]